MLPTSRGVKKQLLGGGGMGSCRYGCEVDPLTQHQARVIRRHAAQALCGNHDCRSRVAALLMLGDCILAPQVQAYFRILENRPRQLFLGEAAGLPLLEYWQVASHDAGRIKGPVRIVAHVLSQAGVQARNPWVWDVPGWPSCAVRTAVNFQALALDIARRAVLVALAG